MDSFIAFLNTLNTLSPIAVIALLGLVIMMLVKAKDSRILDVPIHQEKLAEQVDKLSNNHLSDLPYMADSLKRQEDILREAVQILRQMQIEQTSLNSYIRARLNGGTRP